MNNGRESDSDELLRRYSTYSGGTGGDMKQQVLQKSRFQTPTTQSLLDFSTAQFGETMTMSLDEPQYYSIPELQMLSSAVAALKTAGSVPSTPTSTAVTYQTKPQQTTVAEGSKEATNVGSYRPEWEEYWKCEQSIISARASVMVYDDVQKKWVPSGTSSGLSKVQIYHHQQNNTFRVVGRKIHDHEVVINCSILKGLKYNQATATFHQWRDSKFVYGLNFSSQQDAEAFARAMMHALEILSGRLINGPLIATNGNGYDEDMGYRTMTREDAAILQQQQQMTGNVTPSAQTPTSQSNQNIPQSPPTPQGHHRTSSAPPAPQPPPMSMAPPMYNQQGPGPGMMPPPIQQPGNQQSQYHAPQSVTQQQHHPAFNSQPVNAYTNQQGAPLPPPHQNGPIYVASQQTQGIPSSASSNSVVYASQQQQQQQQQQQSQQPLPQQQSSQNLASVGYAQTNGNEYAQIPAAPPLMPSMMSGNNVPIQSAGGTTGRPQQNGPSSSASSSSSTIPSNTGAPQAPPPPPAFAPQIPLPPIQPPSSGLGIAIGGGGPPPVGGAPPPPPPPPIGGLSSKQDSGGGMDMSSLAAQLQNAKLKRNNKTTPPPAENSGSSTSSGGSANYGTIGRTSKGMASMMDEMAKTLARRRAQAEKKEPEPTNEDSVRQRPWEKSNTLPHKLGTGSSGNSTSSNSTNANGNSESPRPIRKRFGSASEETILKQVNGDGLSLALSADLDSIKAEIIREMRLEIQKAKQEIMDAIKSEFNRR